MVAVYIGPGLGTNASEALASTAVAAEVMFPGSGVYGTAAAATIIGWFRNVVPDAVGLTPGIVELEAGDFPFAGDSVTLFHAGKAAGFAANLSFFGRALSQDEQRALYAAGPDHLITSGPDARAVLVEQGVDPELAARIARAQERIGALSLLFQCAEVRHSWGGGRYSCEIGLRQFLGRASLPVLQSGAPVDRLGRLAAPEVL